MTSKIQNARKIIEEFQKRSEKVFARIATNYPSLLKQFDNKLSHSTDVMKDLEILSQGEDSFLDSELGYKLGVTKDLIEESSYFLNENTKAHAGLVTNLEKEINGIKEIDVSINQLKEVSVDMEIISINTLTVAVKAGKAGGAFSYITSEIRKLTQRMIGLADSLGQKGEKIELTLGEYQQTVRGSLGSQQDLLANLEKDISRSFDTFFHETQNVIGILKDLMETAKKIRQPFMKVMQTIQMQDILRQSLDHIILFIDEKEKAAFDDSMDELRFYVDASRLSEEILEDIRKQYVSSVLSFSHEYESLKGLFSLMKDKIVEFRAHFDSVGDTKSIFAENFALATKIIEDVVSSLNKSLKEKSNVSDLSKELDVMVSSVEKDLSAIGTLVDRFQNINIASRIEVARQVALKEMVKNIEEMSDVIVSIESNVTDALNKTKDFIEGTKRVVSQLAEQSKEESSFIKTFSSQLKDMYEEIYNEGSKMQHSISHFSLVEGDFLSSFSIIEEDLNDLQDLESLLEELGGILEKSSADFNVQYQEALEKRNLTSWEVKDDRIKKLLDQFTIYTHKKAASDAAGIELSDDSVETGDVTLF
ncbi:hypothetical protein [Spirochaeta cellobiosiphila]|uniref:hypothetical protein n=1 Tax=Spirochaeta cellobiosiphila TaxID=504483 RepID=UPI00048C364F|nr:hypothetical protein [Spirochaeta cellobiosiphila]